MSCERAHKMPRFLIAGLLLIDEFGNLPFFFDNNFIESAVNEIPITTIDIKNIFNSTI